MSNWNEVVDLVKTAESYADRDSVPWCLVCIGEDNLPQLMTKERAAKLNMKVLETVSPSEVFEWNA